MVNMQRKNICSMETFAELAAFLPVYLSDPGKCRFKEHLQQMDHLQQDIHIGI